MFDITDIALEEFNERLNEHLNLDREFEFEFVYHLWTSQTSNIKKVEIKKIKFDRVEINFGNSFFYAKIFTKIDVNEWFFFVLEETNSTYIDLENKKPFELKMNDTISVDRYKENLTRKEQRDLNNKFPYVISYKAVCYSYHSTEFINDIKSILGQINKKLK